MILSCLSFKGRVCFFLDGVGGRNESSSSTRSFEFVCLWVWVVFLVG